MNHTGQEPPPEQPARARKPRSRFAVTLVILFGVLVFIVLAMMTTPDQPPNRVPEEVAEVVEVWQLTVRAVTDRLRSPSTADFGLQQATDPGRVTRIDRGRYPPLYRVVGWVDAQNAFGATIRSSFIVEVVERTDGRKGVKFVDFETP